ncbi:MAG: penicillin-insensitive murein endopeptidase [Myxococcales bacterium]|nr:penicillin-insensitive murein endopeptidase [Myxococcales bacterium]
MILTKAIFVSRTHRMLLVVATVLILALPTLAMAEGNFSSQVNASVSSSVQRDFSADFHSNACKTPKRRLNYKSQYRYSKKSGFVLLPGRGKGYYHFSGPDHPEEDAWGAPEAIACVELVAAEWSTRYPKRPRVGIGDISRRNGGRFAPHVTHRNGLDIDVRPMKRSSEGRTTVSHNAYSRAYTKDLIDLFTEVCAVQRVLFNDPVLIKQMKNVRRSAGHHDHLHVSLKSAVRQPEAVVERANQIRMIARGNAPVDSPQTASNP